MIKRRSLLIVGGFNPENVFGIEYLNSGRTWRNIDYESNVITPTSTYRNNHPIYSGMEVVTIDSCTMVTIPKFYFLYTKTSGGHKWWISNEQFYIPEVGLSKVHSAFIYNGSIVDSFYVGAYETSPDPNDSSKAISTFGGTPITSVNFSTMVTRCTNRNNGTTINHFALWNVYQLNAIQMLFLIDMGGSDSQTLIGNGQSSALQTSGNSNVVWRNIHELWGNAQHMVQGLENRTKVYYLWTDAGNTTFYNTTVAVTNTGWATDIYEDFASDYGLFIPSVISSAESDGMFYDKLWVNASGNRVLYHGGKYTSGTGAGLFNMAVDQTASTADARTTGRLSYY